MPMNDEALALLNEKYIARTPHMREIGMRITALERGRGTMLLPARPDWMGDPVRGLMHPGALTVLADSACGLAVGSMLDKRVPYATLDLRMDYLRPAGPDRDTCCAAQCYRMTRSVAFVRAEVWQDDPGAPIAVAQGTFMLGTASRARAPAGARDDEPAWAAPERSDPLALGRAVPYVDFLGIRHAPAGEHSVYRMPFQQKLVGNPWLPALHGGVIAGFAETAATVHLIANLPGSKFPKSVDFSIDYLRSGRPEETFSSCETVRVGTRAALVQVRCWQKSPDYPIAAARAHFLLAKMDDAARPAPSSADATPDAAA